MATLPGLPNLPSIADAASSAATSVAQSAAQAADQATLGIFTGNTTKYVMIILGLLLIAAGIFSFDKTRELIVQGGKAAALAA
jgi:LPXTG-motif cell wall-anchored protein